MWLIIGNKYTFELAQEVSQKSIQVAKKGCLTPIHMPFINQGGLAIQLWQYVLCATGNTQYLVTTEFDSIAVQAIMDGTEI